MTHFSDRLVLGAAITNPVIGSSGGFGVKTSPLNTLDIQPLTANATGVAAVQTPGSAALTLSAGTGVTAVVDAYGVTRYTFDVARCVTVTSGGVDTGINFLIKGYDIYGQAMSQALTGASGAAATTTKAFASVISITPSGAVATTASAGTADVFGLPVVLSNGTYLNGVKWGTAITSLGNDTGTLVLAVATTATTTTGDVRGTYAPSSASDGTKRLVLSIGLSVSQASETATALAVFGVTQA